MHDYDPFEDFIGGMSMPELPIGAPIPVSGEELLDVPSAIAKQIRTLIRARIEKYIEHPTHHWDDQLDVLQLLIRDEVLSTVVPKVELLEPLSPEEIVGNTAFTFMTLAMLIYSDLTEPDDEPFTPTE